MLLLILGFVAILTITFAVIALATGPSQGQKVLEHRLSAIKAGESGGTESSIEATQILKVQHTSRMSWLEDILERYKVSQKLQLYIAQSSSTTTVSNLMLSSLLLGVLAYGVTYFFAPILPVDLVAGGVVAALPVVRVAWKRSRRISAFNAALPEAIDMMARALRAGHSMVSAIEMISQHAVEPAGSEFGEVFKQQNFGLPLREALMQMLDRVPSQDLRVLVTAILVQRETGGNLVEILDRTVFIIRERLRIQGDIRVHTAQGRMTGWILSLLPAGLLVIINIVNPGYSHVLLADPMGRRMIYIGVGLIVVGTAIIYRIVNGIEV
jgi:tight adherence protein B